MSKRVLVVEDQEDNMRIMNDVLANAGYEVIGAVTGVEGVAFSCGRSSARTSAPRRAPCSTSD